MKNRNLSGADAGRFAGGAPNARSVGFERFGTPQGVMAAMYPYMYQDTKFNIDDFDGAELSSYWEWDSDLDGNPWSLQDDCAEAGTGAGAGVKTTTLFGQENLKPSKNCGVEIRWQVSQASDLTMEVGLVNILAGGTRSPIISDIDTPAAVALNTGAVFHISQVQTLATGAFAISANAGATVSKTAIGTFTPTVDNFYTLRVQTVFDNSAGYKAFFYLWDTNASRMTLVASGNTSISSATAATTSYRPWFLVRNEEGDDEVRAKIDYIARWQDR